MKIRKLQLKNIGVFDDETINFQECPAKDKAEIHILTGENGSGKTTILMALANCIKYDPITIWESLITAKDQTFFKRLRNGCDLKIETDLKNEEDLKNVRNIFRHFAQGGFKNSNFAMFFTFAPFAYSGYRRLKDEKINLFDEVDEHSLYQALDFVKDENSKFTINQWLGRSLSKRALALEDENKDASKFTENIKNLELIVADIVEYEIRFKLKIDLSLVLIKDNQELDFDVLPDGLKSLISWIGDLLMRLDSLNWKDDTPIFDREIILFLDEIEVHLHPAWQRKVLPIVQKLFKNAQIFVSTHSPFVVNSVDDAWVYELEVKDGKAKVREVTQSNTAYSIQTVLREIFGIDEKFGEGTQEKLVGFLDKSKQIQRNNGKSEINKDDFLNLAIDLAEKSAEFQSIVFVELAKITQKLGEPYEI